MAGGTEAFPDLGRHCQHPDCNQLDFLPFTCDGCKFVFCLEHRSFKSHECPKSDHNSRKVIICELCSTSIETTGRDGEDEKAILERHEKSKDCNPLKKKKPKCPAKRCREVLTFSNTAICKSCHGKVCLKHRFPADHSCNSMDSTVAVAIATGLSGPSSNNPNFLAALASRLGKECGINGGGNAKGKVAVSSPRTPSVKAR
ncbi:hypothetical protein V2J09_019769 [Rumex salicifolius]